jgi:enterochelin esterase-like enzyme
VRRLVVLVGLVVLTGGCQMLQQPPEPTPLPTPSPTRFVPAQLLTPRPTQPAPTATPAPRPAVGQRPTAVPTPTPSVPGTPVAAAEPLQGMVLEDQLFSPIVGMTLPYRVYLPPDYLKSQRRYPVLYMLHGTGGNYTEWTDSFLPEQADRLIVAHEIPALIVMMPDDGGSTYWANWSNDGPRWGDYVTDDVVSVVDGRYRTLASRASRAIGGLSMGGLGALNLAFQHPDVFGVVGGHSPSVRLEPDPALWFLVGQNFWEHNPVWLAQNRDGLDTLAIWLDAGTEDVWLPNVQAVHDALAERGIPHEWHVLAGPHEAEYWMDHLPEYLRFYGAALKS